MKTKHCVYLLFVLIALIDVSTTFPVADKELDHAENQRIKRQQSMFLCFSEVSTNGTECIGERLGSVSTIEECCHPASIGGLEGEGYTQVGSTGCSECPVNITTDVQIKCYSAQLCDGESFTIVPDIRSCCLLDGEQSFTIETMGMIRQCQQCVVVAWLSDSTVFLAETVFLSEPIPVGYLKGAELGLSTPLLRAISKLGTADERDFLVNDPNVDLDDEDDVITVSIRADDIALELNETFQLVLESVGRLQPNEFILDTLNIVILDSDIAEVLLTEIDYRLSPEDDGLMRVIVEVRTQISSPIFLRVVPLEAPYVASQINASNIQLEATITAEVTADLNPFRPQFANSTDYDNTTVLVRVDSNGDFEVGIPVTPDNIYEPDQIFVVLLELANESLADLVSIPQDTRAAVCRIIDDDSIQLTWDRPSYTYTEGVNTIDIGTESAPIVMKQDIHNTSTEYRLEIYAQPFTFQDTTFPAAEWSDVRGEIGSRRDNDFAVGTSTIGVVRFFQKENISNIIDVITFKDEVYNEGIEVIGLEFVNDENNPEFLYGTNPIALLYILDTNLTVGFERECTNVSEGVGSFELCVKILTPELPVKDSFSLANPFSLELLSVNGTANVLDYFEVTPANNPLVAFETDNSTHTQCFNVTIIDDKQFEFTEEFMFMLSLMGNSDMQSVVVDPYISRVRIVDNDAVRIGFEITEHTVVETEGEITLVVSVLEGETTTPITICFSTLNGTAISGTDFSHTKVMLMFDEVSDSINITIPITVDTTVENDEVFSAILSLVGPLEFSDKITLNPESATIAILDDSGPANVTRVNDTIIGDPLFTVPLRVINLEDFGLEQDISLCYEVHGEPDRYFNLVSDVCTSVNAHYVGVGVFNVIDNVGVRAVGEDGVCRELSVSIQDGCSVSVDGMIVESSYNAFGISVRRYPNNRVRVSVPNCAHLSLVMWMFCRNRTLTSYDSDDNPVVTEATTMKFVIARGYNLQERSHGLLGQFWNIPITIDVYNGTVEDSAPTDAYYSVTVAHPDFEPRTFLAFYYPRTWEVVRGQNDACLYAGSDQAAETGGISTLDPVIQGSYTDYIVNDEFETEYRYSKFESDRCL